MTALPLQYADLNNFYKTPLAAEALKLFGVTEFAGAANNPIILGWSKELGHTIEAFYKKDEIAWCALYISVCAKRAGYLPPAGFESLRAKSFAKWGDPISGEPVLWDILVFDRQGGGHVGIYVGEDKSCYHVLGGNQGDKVSIVRIPKERLSIARREPLNSSPKSLKRLYREPKGQISQNEA
jgi:uncharacterized protein (TIGR02594 family)